MGASAAETHAAPISKAQLTHAAHDFLGLVLTVYHCISQGNPWRILPRHVEWNPASAIDSERNTSSLH
jgi:hypothetical protein